MHYIRTGVPQGSVLGPLLFIIYMNDISKVSHLFHFINYADDSTLSSTLQSFGNPVQVMINHELKKISNWLKANKLSLNIEKTKYMIFHPRNKAVNDVRIQIDGKDISRVVNFNLLGIVVNERLDWKPHVNMIAVKISKSVGILNRLKNILPLHVKLTIYHSLIASYFNYGILVWGYQCQNLFTLQKKAVRHITLSRYNAHTTPLFKSLNILQIFDVFKLYQLKFFHKFLNAKLPTYFQNMPFIFNLNFHEINTRQRYKMHINRVSHTFAEKSIRYSLPKLINETSLSVFKKVFTHSFDGFTHFAKNILFHVILNIVK